MRTGFENHEQNMQNVEYAYMDNCGQLQSISKVWLRVTQLLRPSEVFFFF